MHGNAIIESLDEATVYVRERWPKGNEGPPALGIIAGSGLSALGALVEDAVRLPYTDIPHMPGTKVVGHKGELVLGTLEGVSVAVLSGRAHGYEGHPMSDVVFGARLLGRLGAPAVLLTNAAGGLTGWLHPGSLLRIVDHINMTGSNPLIGENVAALGPRFPDMSRTYCPDLGARLEASAEAVGVSLLRGVYVAVSGPSYETPAEVRMLRGFGADVVGMSTVPEAIALSHMGIKVLGVSVVTNYASGVSAAPLDHAEVKEVAAAVGPRLLRTLKHFVASLADAPRA